VILSVVAGVHAEFGTRPTKEHTVGLKEKVLYPLLLQESIKTLKVPALRDPNTLGISPKIMTVGINSPTNLGTHRFFIDTQQWQESMGGSAGNDL